MRDPADRGGAPLPPSGGSSMVSPSAYRVHEVRNPHHRITDADASALKRLRELQLGALQRYQAAATSPELLDAARAIRQKRYEMLLLTSKDFPGHAERIHTHYSDVIGKLRRA